MPEIKKLKKYRAICIPLLEGENEKGLNYLKKWAQSKGVKIRDVAICIYYDSPTHFPIEECRRDVCIIFEGNAIEDGDVKIKIFPKQKVASFSFNGEMRKACDEFFKWLEKNGYRRTTPIREIKYSNGKELQVGIKSGIN